MIDIIIFYIKKEHMIIEKNSFILEEIKLEK